jgi:hypothetical protein
LLGWLILSALWGNMPELLAPCWEDSTFKWKLCMRELFYWGHNQSLPIGPLFYRVPGSFDRVKWVLPSDLGLFPRPSKYISDMVLERQIPCYKNGVCFLKVLTWKFIEKFPSNLKAVIL